MSARALWEEVDVIRAPIRRASPRTSAGTSWRAPTATSSDTCDRTGLILPVAEYDHSQGCAIVGGFVGRNPAEPQLYGGYLFGDSCSGNIWALDAAKDGPQTARLVLGSGTTISSFGEDEAGAPLSHRSRLGRPAPDRAELVGPDRTHEGGSRLLRPAPALPPWGDRYWMRKLTATVTVTSFVPVSTGVGVDLSGAATPAASRA